MEGNQIKCNTLNSDVDSITTEVPEEDETTTIPELSENSIDCSWNIKVFKHITKFMRKI